MLSLPIPCRDELPVEPITFDGIAWDSGNLAPIVTSLTKGAVARSQAVHLDPDLRYGALGRGLSWRGAFGQIRAAQAHLTNQGVGVGDLFLFFGWFRKVEYTNEGLLRFVGGAPDIHCIFGWLQIGEVLNVGNQFAKYRSSHPGLVDHPHLNGHGYPENTIYVAADRLTLEGRDIGVRGWGTFDSFREGLRLTAAGRSRSIWNLPGWMRRENGPVLSYHRKPERWNLRENGSTTLQTVAIGQEFVLDCADCLTELFHWLKDIIFEAQPLGENFIT